MASSSASSRGGRFAAARVAFLARVSPKESRDLLAIIKTQLEGSRMSLTQVKPAPPKSSAVVRLGKDVANSNVRARAEHVPGAIEAPLPLTPERLELILAFAD